MTNFSRENPSRRNKISIPRPAPHPVLLEGDARRRCPLRVALSVTPAATAPVAAVLFING